MFAVGVERTLAAVQEAGLGAFVVAGVALAGSIVLRALAWAVLNRPVKHTIPFRSVLAAELVGTAGNMITPSTYLGGEPLKVAYVTKTTGHPLHEVAGTVLLAKYLEALSFMLFFSFGTLVALARYQDVLFVQYPAAGVTLLAAAGGLLTLTGAMWLSLSRRWRPLTRLVCLLARLRVFRRFFVRLRRPTQAMEDQVSRVFCEEGKAAWVAFLAQMGGHVVLFARPGLFLLIGSRIHLGPAALSLIFVVSQALLAFQLTPSGVGPLDGGLIGTFALIGLSEAHCMAYLLCLRFWDVLVIGAGAFIGARAGAGLLTEKKVHLVEEAEASQPPEPQDGEPTPEG